MFDSGKLPDHYLAELRRVGRRRGYPRVAREVFRNVDSMIAARALYGRVTAPVTLIYGDHDWSRVPERQANLARWLLRTGLVLPLLAFLEAWRSVLRVGAGATEDVVVSAGRDVFKAVAR